MKSGRRRLEVGSSHVSARDHLENEVAKLASIVLAVEPVGVTTPLHEIGANSMAMVRLLTRIEERFGRKLLLSRIGPAVTVEEIAHLLRETAHDVPPTLLVPIQRAGTRPPIFGVHGAFGHVARLYDLARTLGPTQPFYALQAAGLDGDEPALDQLEEMASRYIAAARTVARPGEPYVLTGYSFGGVIAFEMANQLRRAGERVALVALLDSEAPNDTQRYDGALERGMPDFLRRRELKQVLGSGNAVNLERVALVNFFLNYTDQLPPLDQLDDFASEDRVARVLEDAKRRKLIPRDVGVSHVLTSIRVAVGMMTAELRYKPEPYPGRLTLIRTNTGWTTTTPGHDMTLGWTPLSTEPIDVHVVEGGHVDFLDEPVVREVADIFRRALATG